MAGKLFSPINPTTPKPAPKIFSCSSCGVSLSIRALGHTVSIACTSCGSIIDATNENYKILSTAAQKIKIEPLIPLGQRGKLHGVLWEAIGFMKRSDGSGQYSWSEYLLFNPTRGFRWLTEFDGHWNSVVNTKGKPTLSGNHQPKAKYMNKSYSLFHQGRAKVFYVVGEFYWQIKVGEEVAVRDYVSPPEILSSEQSKTEIVWSIGEYVDALTIKDAFQIKMPMPEQKGVAPNQPSTFSPLLRALGRYWLIFVGILFVLQLFNVVRAHKTQAYQGVFNYGAQDMDKVKVSPAFELKHGLTNVEFRLYAPVQNNWLELQIDLVNDQNGTTYEFEHGVEYYSGRDSDGAWTEGNTISYRTLYSIPEGTYHLNIEASGPANNSWSTSTNSMGINYQLTVTRDVVLWSNFYWSLVLVSIFPFFVWWRGRRFELSRWSNSDFSPYWEHKGE